MEPDFSFPRTEAAVLPVSTRDGFWRGLLQGRLRALAGGRITLVDGDGAETFGPADANLPRAKITVRDPSFYRRTVLRGLMGAAESYIDGAWHSDDLSTLVRVMAHNRQIAERLDASPAAAARSLLARLARRRNTRAGSRENIAAHYDLGNDFFAAFLDRTMTYSTAVWDDPAIATLDDAAVAKYERVCNKLDLEASDHVLEIGTGWGGFAIHAASRHGCRVTTTTISREQYALARERVAAAGLDGRVNVVLQDYRDLEGTYDKLVSIEMIEAVGHEFMDEYFRRCCARLRDDGLFLLEAITIPDQDFEASKRSMEFIKRYVFPGGALPSVWSMCDTAKRATDFRMLHLEELSEHYAETLAHWSRRLRAERGRLRRSGTPERLLRTWEFYFAYCEGGFRERAIGTVQILFERPRGRRAPVLGTLSRSAAGADALAHAQVEHELRRQPAGPRASS
jgi:cyclopropane-fatty-acyl-phospholipid synthase